MARYTSNSITFPAVEGKVVVLTGGANGIGAATVELFHTHGAKVVFGDVDEVGGNQVMQKLSSKNVDFLKTDVTDYKSLLALFKYAFEKYGRVDVAMPFAGIIERGNWFDPQDDMSSIQQIPNRLVLDVNLLGPLCFSRIASVYLRQGADQGADKSILLMSSIAGYKEVPGMFLYQASKHGIVGLMRSLRQYLPGACGIRVNVISPWMTDTIMTSGFASSWKAANLPVNTPVDIARIALTITCESELNGKSFWVEGGRAWELEENIDRLEPEWLGKEPSESLAKGQALLGAGESWQKGTKR